MDQESSALESCRSSGSHGPLVRRRRSLALAAATVLASASTAAGFSPSPSRPLTSHANQHSLHAEGSSHAGHPHQRRSLHVLGMVSFLELPTTTVVPIKSSKKKRVSARATRVRKSPPKESRTIEIELQPDYDMLGQDDFVIDSSTERRRADLPSASASDGKAGRREEQRNHKLSSDASITASRHVPDIDTEILYEGITSAPASLKGQALSSSQKDSLGESVKPASADTKVVAKTNQSKSTKSKSGSGKKPIAKKKSRSSTMPGFVKDKELDLHIANLGLKNLPSSERKLTRMFRSKSAKLKRRQTNSENLYKKSASVPDSMLEYVHEIHAIDRVTPKEEKELGTLTQEAIRLQKLHDDLQEKYGREPSDDEYCAAAGKVNMFALQEAIEDGMEAKNQLVASNLRMVQRVVNLYIRNGLGSEYSASDLMQDGTMALIRAAEKYEPDRGFRFSTYAMYWIRSAVKRSQTSQSRIVTVPQRIHETHKRISKVGLQLRKELGREATKDELAAASDITVVQLDRCRKAMSQVTYSLDAELENSFKPNNGSSRKDTMYDIVEGQVDETEYERTQRLLMKEHLIGTLRRYLSPHEVDLLLLRYGLMDDKALPKGMSGPLTIAEVSKLVGLKPDKVRRIIINSQKQLRHLMREWEDFEYELA